jgi:hypothetical protein
MGLPVSAMAKEGKMQNGEGRLPKGAIRFTFTKD